jgi:23S rRNA (cytosine1962-C5)-methyltransferase
MSRTVALEDLLLRAFERRLPLLTQHEACRLVDGAGDHLADVFIDKFSSVLVVHILSETIVGFGELTSAGFWNAKLLNAASASTVYLWVHQRQARATARSGATLVVGPSTPVLEVHEHGLALEVRPEAQLNAGLFLDMRDLRERLRARAKHTRMLNLFCFTGTLGLAAYAGGASEIVQIDTSKSALNWARANFARNQKLGQGAMRFIAEDARTFVDKEIRRRARGGSPYDIIVVDPPSFGVSKRRSFSFARDLDELLCGCVTLLAPSGTLVVTANNRSTTALEIKKLLTTAVQQQGRAVKQLERLAPPRDFSSPEANSVSMRGWWVSLN